MRGRKGDTRLHRALGPLLVLNLLVVIGIVYTIWRRDAPAPEAPMWTAPVARTVDWSARFADDAAPDGVRCPDCNLVVVSVDIFRADHMPCNGYPRQTTPFICAMAEHGTQLDNFIVHTFHTPISQMALFTGRYPSNSGYVNYSSTLGPEEPYFPAAMKAAGYDTVAMGSSFEVMTDMSSIASGPVRFTKAGLNPGLSFGRGFDRFIFTGNRNMPTDAIPWLQTRADRKFFLWIILGNLHWPYGQLGDPDERDMFDPPGYAGPFAKTGLNFDVVSRIYRNTLWRGETGGAPEALGPDDTAYVNARYDYGMVVLDRFIGELVANTPPELLKKTVFVLHGVHGEDLGEHGYIGHYDIFDTEVRSSFIVLNPKHRVEGVRIDEQVEGVDLAPTLLDVLGLPPLPKAQGTSFLEALRTGEGDPERLTYAERVPLWEEIFRHRNQMPTEYTTRVASVLDGPFVPDTMVRSARWKLIHRRSREVEAQVSWFAYLTGEALARNEWELYDLAADPDELSDVYAANPQVAAQLQAKLLAWEAAQ